jgi:hypothetical protein
MMVCTGSYSDKESWNTASSVMVQRRLSDQDEDGEEAKSAVDSGCGSGGHENDPSQLQEAALRLKGRQKSVRNW